MSIQQLLWVALAVSIVIAIMSYIQKGRIKMALFIFTLVIAFLVNPYG